MAKVMDTRKARALMGQRAKAAAAKPTTKVVGLSAGSVSAGGAKLTARSTTAQVVTTDQKVDLSQFPMGDDQHRIDVSFVEPYMFKVFYWAKRPDAEMHSADEQFHWHPDSEFTSLEKAEARMNDLKKGARRRSILMG